MTSPASRRSVRTPAALAAWAALIATAYVIGQRLLPGGHLAVASPPFQGHYRFLLRAAVPGTAFALAAVLVLPSLCRWFPWRLLMPMSVLTAAGWALALAVWDGHGGVSSPINRASEYLPAIGFVGNDPVHFLSTFAERVRDSAYPVHVKGHPPLMVLVFWAWDHLAPGPVWAAALVIGAGASSVAALAVTLRALGDETAARRALPFLILGPFAITIATSADAFFLGVASWSVATLVTGLQRRSPVLLALCGLLLGALPYLSYALPAYGAILLAAGWLAVRRFGWPRPLHALVLVLGAALLPVLLTAGGFWWPDGVAATRIAWLDGYGSTRPYLYSFLGDVAILAVLVGPATAVAAVRRQGRVTAALAGSAFFALLVLGLSGVTRLETERIWMPFAPWLVLLTAALPGRARGWLLLNAACAITFQLLVRDVW